jgi:hypothetical protein
MVLSTGAKGFQSKAFSRKHLKYPNDIPQNEFTWAKSHAFEATKV